MKFLIQTIDNRIVHDFSFTLIEAIKYHKYWGNDMTYYLHEGIQNFAYVSAEHYCPVGTVEFVHNFYKSKFGGRIEDEGYLKPLDVFGEIASDKFMKRNTYKMYIPKESVEELIGEFGVKKYFFKECSKVKGFTDICTFNDVPEGQYSVSELIDIESEWRCFVYQNKLVGLQHYCGDFTIFPDVPFIDDFIKTFSEKDYHAPVAYTLDVGINKIDGTFVIELHNFYSCGLYGFADLQILPYMFWRWHNGFINNLKLCVGNETKYT